NTSLDAHGLVRNIGRSLQVHDIRRTTENQFYRIKDPRYIASFLKIESIGDTRRQRATGGAHSHQQFVFTRFQSVMGVEITRRKTGPMVSQHLSVENNVRAEQRF